MRPSLVATLALALGLAARSTSPLAAQDSSKADTARHAARQPLPLEPTRHDTLTLNEGTWISLDVSPDGQTVAFDLLDKTSYLLFI